MEANGTSAPFRNLKKYISNKNCANPTFSGGGSTNSQHAPKRSYPKMKFRFNGNGLVAFLILISIRIFPDNLLCRFWGLHQHFELGRNRATQL